VTAVDAGLRPATEGKEYRIRAREGRSAITVGGIRSTGLSAALGIARHVAGLARDLGHAWEPPREPAWPRVPSISEAGERD
jgi:glycerol-3-phosphate dehydrogenase